MNNISFTYPLFALLFILLPFIWLFPGGQRRISHLVLRSAILALVTLGLMRPVFISELDNKHFAIILDQSSSLTESAQQEAIERARELHSRYEAEGEVSVVQIGGDSPEFEGDNVAHITEERTPLGDALELAAQSIPVGVKGSVTLISDGLSTDQHWGQAFDHLTDRGIPVHAVQLDLPSDIYISDVRSYDTRAGDNAKVFVDIIGSATDFRIQAIDVKNEEVLIDSDPLSSDNRLTAELTFQVEKPGFFEIEVSLIVPEDQDPDPSNNRMRRVLPIQDPVRMLYLGERQEGAPENLKQLLSFGFDIYAPQPDQLTPDMDLGAYDVVMLDDVPVTSIDDGVLQNINDAVRRQGLGLIHSGGEAAYGDGGYHDSPVTDLLPVDIPGDQDKIDPSVGLAIILDTSGSMAGSRIELAKHIARIAVRRMQPHDRIGIVEFYGNKHWAIPMQPATNKIEIDRAIGRMKAIGGTVLFPAVQEAYYGLKNVNTRFKHIILITDAGVEDANYEAMVRSINRDRISVSTILVGQGGHNQIMSDIANWGGGRFYAVGNQFQLVELIFKQSSTKKSPMYKRGSFPLVATPGRGWWGEIDPEAILPLDGYVEVSARDGAEVLLAVEDTEHPVVATWLYGLGRVTTVSTEPVGEGTRTWSDWKDYPEFLGRLIRRTAPEVRAFEIDVRRKYGVTDIVAHRVARNEDLTPELNLYTIDSKPEDSDHPFKETAPGLFEAEVRTAENDDVFIGIGSNMSDREWRAVSLAGTDQSQENQVDPRSGLDLTSLALETGGEQISDSPSSTVVQNLSPGELSYGIIDIRPWMFLLALLVYLSDLVYRRWPKAN